VKLLTKLTLFITLSKLAIVLFFVSILPYLIERIANKYTNDYLREQQKKVLSIVARNGIDYYLQGEDSYGSYTMLKEEYIALEPAPAGVKSDVIENSQRVVEQDTLDYRVLSYTFRTNNKNYLLEIGKTTATISQYNRPLQRIALFVLISLVGLTILIDLLFSHSLLKPLSSIIRTKLLNQKFPFNEDISPVKTTTSDFKYLDDSLITLMAQINLAFEKEREFTANASHEFMTPISILQNKIENLMLEDEVTENIQQKLVEMMRTLNRLKKIVRSLLLISRIENEQFVKSDTVKVKQLFEEIIEEMEHRLDEKHLVLKLEISSRVVVKNANRDLLYQLFFNLVNNAIKYNQSQGKIEITEEKNKSGKLLIVIEDTGIGIDAEQLPFIFNRFQKATLTEGGGFGLGLSIVQSIASYHGIELKVSSEIGNGTRFDIVFPEDMLAVRSSAMEETQ
jgi:signal transduction histidine kinase